MPTHARRRGAGRLLVALAVLALVVPALTACSSAGTPSATAGGVSVSEAWARPSMGMDRAGAAYLTISNASGSADALVGVTSPAAATCELHETMPGSSGMTAMQPVTKIDVPKGGSVELKPGGYHIMLIGLKEELKPGTTIQLTLTFEKAGPLTVTAEVRAN